MNRLGFSLTVPIQLEKRGCHYLYISVMSVNLLVALEKRFWYYFLPFLVVILRECSITTSR